MYIHLEIPSINHHTRSVAAALYAIDKVPFVLFTISIVPAPFARLVSPITGTKSGSAFARAVVAIVT